MSSLAGEAGKLVRILRREGFLDGARAVRRFVTGAVGEAVYLPYLAWRYEDPVVPRTVYGNTMYLDRTDPGISRTLLTKGVHEYKSTQLFRQEIDPGDVHVDVGANVGYYALQAASLAGDSGQVLAVEPVAENVDLLERSVRANGYRNVSVHNVALSDESRSAAMTLTDTSNKGTLLDASTEDVSEYKESELATKAEGTTEVPTTTLDELLSRVGVGAPDVIRMDIEGYEHRAIDGMTETLSGTDAPSVLFVELHPTFFDDPDATIGETVRTILDHGYDPELLVDRHVVERGFDRETFPDHVGSIDDWCPQVLFRKP